MTIVINKQIIRRLNGLYESFNIITEKINEIKKHKNGLTLSLSNFIERSMKNKSLLNVGFNTEKSNKNFDNNSNSTLNNMFSVSKQLDNNFFSDEEIYMSDDDDVSDNSEEFLSYKENNFNNYENIERLQLQDQYKDKNIMVNNINNINNIHILNNNITNINDLQILGKMKKISLSKNSKNNNNNNKSNNSIKLNAGLPPMYNFNDNNKENKEKKLKEKNNFKNTVKIK